MTNAQSETEKTVSDIKKLGSQVDMLHGVMVVLQRSVEKNIKPDAHIDPEKLKLLRDRLFEVADIALYTAENVNRAAGAHDTTTLAKVEDQVPETTPELSLPQVTERQLVLLSPEEIEERVQAGVSAVLATNPKPVITIREIIARGFGGKLDHKNHARVSGILHSLKSLRSVGQGEYAVIERGSQNSWIDTALLASIVQKAISDIKAKGDSSLIIHDIVAAQVRGGLYMTTAERKVLKAQFALEGNVTGTVFRLPHNHEE